MGARPRDRVGGGSGGTRAAVWGLGPALLLTACAWLGPPDWVGRPPADDRYVHALGAAGVTYEGDLARSREIARQRALQRLVDEIAAAALAGAAPEPSAPPSGRRARITLTEQDLEAVEVVHVWVDERGRAGPPNQTWVLVRLPRERARLIAARSF